MLSHAVQDRIYKLGVLKERAVANQDFNEACCYREAIDRLKARNPPLCPCEVCSQMRPGPGEFPSKLLCLCSLCNNKRCPHAQYHGYRCTDSNADGQQPVLLEGFPPRVDCRLFRVQVEFEFNATSGDAALAKLNRMLGTLTPDAEARPWRVGRPATTDIVDAVLTEPLMNLLSDWLLINEDADLDSCVDRCAMWTEDHSQAVFLEELMALQANYGGATKILGFVK